MVTFLPTVRIIGCDLGAGEMMTFFCWSFRLTISSNMISTLSPLKLREPASGVVFTTWGGV